jgi:iron complex outermembrane receptor protein
MSGRTIKSALLGGVSLSIALMASQALAQSQAGQVAPPAAQAASPSGTGLEEVVVTATRQRDTVNRVALSIAAVTQQTLDQQGVKVAGDITRLVPGLNLPQGGGGSSAGTTGVAIFSVRGVVGSTGAATTGVYLDDTSLTKRNNNGVSQNNGAPLPILFDLDRVEVLKGPQGTLYGGSSEGGTIRFITPTPSLTKTSGALQVEGDNVEGGGNGYTVGGVIGGPIVPDKLGIRISALDRLNPGWINAYSPYTDQEIGKNVNGEGQWMVRGSILWAPTDKMTVLYSGYHSTDRYYSQVTAPTQVYSKSANGQRAGPNETFTTPAGCFDTRFQAAFVPYQPGAPINTAPAATPVVEPHCTPSTPVANQFNRPSYTYGPYNWLPKNGALLTNQQSLTGRDTELDVHSVTLGYDFGFADLKSVSSYVKDHTYSENAGGEDETQQQTIVGGPVGATGAGVVGFPLWAGLPDYPGHFEGQSSREGWEEDLRLTSKPTSRPFTWTAGFYYEKQDVTNRYIYTDRLNPSLESFWGENTAQRYGVVSLDGSDTTLNAHLNDNDYAVYGEGNYWVTSKLKLTVGLRVSWLHFTFDQIDAGPFGSRYFNSVEAYSAGKADANPVTPKFGIEYDFSPADLVYFTAAQGFRAGGANSPISPAVCNIGLALYGITADQVPSSYQPDSVWSYEVGDKMRLMDGKMQLNTALYRIDWSNIQATITPPCGQGFVINGGRAQSQGVDFQGQYRPIPPLTLGLNVGFDDAKYIDPVSGPLGAAPGRPNAINAGDHFPIPPWQLSASARYDFEVVRLPAYVRLDYQWQSGYQNPGTFGVAAYNPYTLDAGGLDQLNGRLGIAFNNWDLNIYANNIIDRNEKVGNAGDGVSQCTTAGGPSCAAYNNFNPFVSQAYQMPRVVGVQANYRF